MKALSALTSRYNVILVNRKGGDKMNDNTIEIRIENGKLVSHGCTENGWAVPFGHLRLKDIAVVIETLKKEQEKIMNKQKDETQKGFGTFSKHLKIDSLELANGVKVLPYKNGIRIEQKNGHVLFANTQPITSEG